MAAVGKFPIAIGKLMIGKTLTTNGEEITNDKIGNDALPIGKLLVIISKLLHKFMMLTLFTGFVRYLNRRPMKKVHRTSTYS